MTTDAHESNSCCCKWHGSACCYRQFVKAERRVMELLAGLGDPDLRCGKTVCVLGQGHDGRCRL